MILDHDNEWAAVSAREDVDGTTPTIVYCPDRSRDDERTEIEMSPAEARKLARALNKAAKRLS